MHDGELAHLKTSSSKLRLFIINNMFDLVKHEGTMRNGTRQEKNGVHGDSIWINRKECKEF